MNIFVRFTNQLDIEFVSQDNYISVDIVARKIEWQEVLIAELDGKPVGYARIEYIWSLLPCISLIHVMGETQRRGRITKAGNARIRWLLVEAAWRVATNKKRPETEALRNWADRIARRRGKRVAMVALARKLSGILYAMWRDGSAYDPAKLSGVHRRAAEKAA